MIAQLPPAPLQHGLTLIEVLVSICILSMALAGATRMVSAAMQANQDTLAMEADFERNNHQYEQRLVDQLQDRSAALGRATSRCLTPVAKND